MAVLSGWDCGEVNDPHHFLWRCRSAQFLMKPAFRWMADLTPATSAPDFHRANRRSFDEIIEELIGHLAPELFHLRTDFVGPVSIVRQSMASLRPCRAAGSPGRCGIFIAFELPRFIRQMLRTANLLDLRHSDQQRGTGNEFPRSPAVAVDLPNRRESSTLPATTEAARVRTVTVSQRRSHPFAGFVDGVIEVGRVLAERIREAALELTGNFFDCAVFDEEMWNEAAVLAEILVRTPSPSPSIISSSTCCIAL
jgi:hypothetical protein